MKARLTTIWFGLCVAGSWLHAQETEILLSGNFLAGIRREAARTHPAVVASEQRTASAEHEIRGVRLWEDPMLGLGLTIANRMMRQEEGDVSVGIEQQLPQPGRVAAERAKGEASHQAALQSARASALSVGADAARTAIELALADESIALQQAQIRWLRAMADNARQLAVDPQSSGGDALRMETELAKEQQLLDAAKRTRGGYAQKLNLVLGRSLDSPWPTLKLPAKPPPVPLVASEVARIPNVNPSVRAMKELVAAARAETRLADRDRLPKVSLGVDANIHAAAGDVRSSMVGVKMTLPWFNEGTYQEKIAAAKSRELAATQEVESLRREIAGLVIDAATEAANAGTQAQAFSGEIYDKAELASRTIEARWISSKATLTDLLDSARSLFSIRLEQRRMIARQLAALEQLETLVPSRQTP